jgi:hypothetical protein
VNSIGDRIVAKHLGLALDRLRSGDWLEQWVDPGSSRRRLSADHSSVGFLRIRFPSGGASGGVASRGDLGLGARRRGGAGGVLSSPITFRPVSGPRSIRGLGGRPPGGPSPSGR